jgi:uncharacterized protein YkwD
MQHYQGSITRISLRLHFVIFGGLLLTAGVFVPGARAQGVEGRPVARLITAAPAGSRPRRVNSLTVLPAPAIATLSTSLLEANPIEKRAFDETNRERVKNGLQPFVWDADLCRMARSHSENMARLGHLFHVTPDGLRLRDRARAVGITRYAALGENIAYNLGYDDPGAFAVERWMISPGHRENILYAGFTSMAVGTFVAADGSVYLTQTFITR